jgi:D-Tyr-tRNAtyr deacylase
MLRAQMLAEHASPYPALIAADADAQRLIQRYQAQWVLWSEANQGKRVDQFKARVKSMSEQEVTELAEEYEAEEDDELQTTYTTLREIFAKGRFHAHMQVRIHTHTHRHIGT